MIRRPPRPTLFPSTTLCRSPARADGRRVRAQAAPAARRAERDRELRRAHLRLGPAGPGPRADRSEEHTSELQSRQYLVCRLLLEKARRALTYAVARKSTRVK